MKTNVDEIFLNDKNYKRVTVDRDILWQGTNKQFQLPSRASSTQSHFYYSSKLRLCVGGTRFLSHGSSVDCNSWVLTERFRCQA